MAAPAERALRALTAGHDRPPMAALLAELRTACECADVKPPSRASVYNYLTRVRTPERVVAQLPDAVREALYNLENDSRVPEAQIAFYCFNYGQLGAICFAAGLPWLALYQARRMRGWRRRSRGLIEAVAQARRV